MENLLGALKNLLDPFTKTAKAPSEADLGLKVGSGKTTGGQNYPIYQSDPNKGAGIFGAVATPAPKPTNQSPIQVQAATNPGFHLPGVPDAIAQILGSEMDKYGLATESARVLTHPRQQTYTPQEVQDFGTARINAANKENAKNNRPLIPINQTTIHQYGENWNGGENPQFITADTPTQKINTLQNNGTYDMGLMRNNSGTFKELQGSHKWNTILKNNGITDVSQLDDPTLSVRYAKILGDYYEQDLGYPRWFAWFAAPADLRGIKTQ